MRRDLAKLERLLHEGVIGRREFVWRATLITGSLAAAANYLTACGSAAPSASSGAATSAASGTAPKKDKVTLCTPSVMLTMDPHMHTSTDVYIVQMLVYGYLVLRDLKTKQVMPYLAAEWKALNDTTWEFKLQKDVKFHDGTSLTSEDVKYSLERILDPNQKSPQRGNAAWIDKLETPDPATIRIFTQKPYPLTLDRLTGLTIVPKKFFTEKDKNFLATNMLGAGPYKFVEWKQSERLVLEKNSEYFGGAPAERIKTIVWRPIAEMGTAQAELLNGGVDMMIRYNSPEFVDTIKASPKHRVAAGPIMRVGFVMLDGNGRAGKNPFMEQKVRQAANHAVDVQAMIDNIWKGYAKIENTVVHPDHFGYDASVQRYPYDPAKAKQLLSEAGLGSGFDTNLYFYADPDIVEALQGYFGKVGIRTTLKDYRSNSGALTQLRRGGKIDHMANLHWGTLGYDADEILYPWFHSSSPESYNNTRELDAMLDAGRSTLDQDKRKSLYSQAQKQIMEQAYWVPLYSKFEIDGVDKNLVYEVPVDEQIRFADLRWK